MDFGIIKINGLKIFATHGAYEEEKTSVQEFSLDVSLKFDSSKAAITDSLNLTINYDELCGFIKTEFLARRFNLLEALVNHVGRLILRKYSLAKEVEIYIKKEKAPFLSKARVDEVFYGAKFKWHNVFISVGSNVGNKQLNVEKAIEKLKNNKDILLVKRSEFKETKAYGNTQMDDVLNGVVLIKTLLFPVELLKVLNEIESHLKRDRKFKWSPRTMDLDILFFDDLIINTKELIVPHYDLKNRLFVLEPMKQLAPGFIHPKYLKTMETMYNELI